MKLHNSVGNGPMRGNRVLWLSLSDKLLKPLGDVNWPHISADKLCFFVTASCRAAGRQRDEEGGKNDVILACFNRGSSSVANYSVYSE